MLRLAAFPLAITLAVAPLCAQQTFLSGPAQGFTFDPPSKSFRAVIGLPGAAFFGPALLSGFDTGSVAPHKNYGIGYQQGNCFLVTGLDSDQISSNPVAGLSSQADGITWSGDGSVAVLYSRTGSWLQVLSGLPDNPQLGAWVDLSPLGGSLSGIASDSQGKNIAVAIQGDSGGVFLLTGAQTFAPLLGLANPTALAFSQDAASVYVLDGNAIQLDVVALSDSSFQAFPLGGLQNPSAVASGRDAQGHTLVYVASSNDQILRVFDPTAQQVVVDLSLAAQPTGITILGPNSFVIASRLQPTDPLWLFASTPQPAVYFVPAAQSGAGGTE
jgi:sugar lactone lactonase YvrE